MPDCERLAKLALEARKFSHSPYSHFQVGAALLAEDGRIFTGCNVESCAYSPSNCAERTALFKAVSEGAKRFTAIAVAGGPATETDLLTRAAPPCGVCRQMLFEFCEESMAVILVRSATDYDVCTLGDLLPQAFTPASL